MRLALVGVVAVIGVLVAVSGVVGGGSKSGRGGPGPGVVRTTGQPPTNAARMQACLAKIRVVAAPLDGGGLRVVLPSGRSIEVRFGTSQSEAASVGALYFVNNLVLSVPGTKLDQLDRHVLFNCAY